MDTITADQFKANMFMVIDLIESQGTIAAISTIPENFFNQMGGVLVPQFNAAIESVASTRHLPLIDYHLAMAPLANSGFNSCDFTSTGLAYGYNVRNLLTLEMLDRLRKL